MKIAVQQHLLPGKDIKEKLRWAYDHGAQGIEFGSRLYPQEDYHKAVRDFENSPVPVSTICGNPSFDFLDPDPKKRRASVEECKKVLELAGTLGAVGQVLAPIYGPPRINDLSPLKDAVALEKDLLVALCKELGDVAARHRTLFLLEPLNRYEQHLLRRLADGVEIVERCGHAHVALAAGFFHMNIEENDLPAALRAAGKHVRHVHLAENTRKEPGSGNLDFTAAFEALLEIGFTGFMTYECILPCENAGATLAKSLDYTRGCLAQARARHAARTAAPAAPHK